MVRMIRKKTVASAAEQYSAFLRPPGEKPGYKCPCCSCTFSKPAGLGQHFRHSSGCHPNQPGSVTSVGAVPRASDGGSPPAFVESVDTSSSEQQAICCDDFLPAPELDGDIDFDSGYGSDEGYSSDEDSLPEPCQPVDPVIVPEADGAVVQPGQEGDVGEQPHCGLQDKFDKRVRKGFVNHPLGSEEVHLLRLLKLLKGLPLGTFDSVLDWAETAAQDGLFNNSGKKLPKRKKLLKMLKLRKGLDDFTPKQTPVQLPFAGIPINVTTFDVEEILISLLSDRNLMTPDNLQGHGENNDLFAPPSVDFPLKEGDEDDYLCGDINTGRISVLTHKHLVTNPQLDVPVGVILFVDKTHVDTHGRACLEPIMMTLTIFNRKARSSHSAWRVLGFIPNSARHRTASDATEKNWDYHVVVDHITESLHRIMQHKGGVHWRLKIAGQEDRNASMKFYLHSLLGDHEGHDKATCHYQSRSLQVRCLCRMCNTPTSEMDNPRYQLSNEYRFLTLADMRSKEGAANHSFRFISSRGKMLCGYDKLHRGFDHEQHGINMRAQVDGLHDRCKGDIQTANDCFLDLTRLTVAERLKNKQTKTHTQEDIRKLWSDSGTADSSEVRLFSPKFKKICEKATLVWGVLLQTQSDRLLPRTYFPQGSMSTDKLNAHEYIGLILLNHLLLCSTLGDFLFGNQQSRTETEERGYQRLGMLGDDTLSSWITVFDSILLIDAFERAPQVSERNRKRYGNYLIWYSEFYQKTLARSDGNKFQTLKTHTKTHRAYLIQETGVPSNTDTHVPEHLHIEYSKETGNTTQKRSSTIDQQTGHRVCEGHFIDLNYADIDAAGSDDKSEAQPVTRGSSYCLALSGDGSGYHVCFAMGKGRVAWGDAMWLTDVEQFLNKHLVPKRVSREPMRMPNSYHKGGVTHRAEPAKKSMRGHDLGWNDWAYVEFPPSFAGGRPEGSTGEYPAHLLCYLELDASVAEFHANGLTIRGPGTYVLCHAATKVDNEQVNDNTVLVNLLTKDYVGYERSLDPCVSRNIRIRTMAQAGKKLILYMLPVSSIKAPCIAVPDIFPPKRNYQFRAEENLVVSRVEYLQVPAVSTWQDLFEEEMEYREMDNIPPPVQGYRQAPTKGKRGRANTKTNRARAKQTVNNVGQDHTGETDDDDDDVPIAIMAKKKTKNS